VTAANLTRMSKTLSLGLALLLTSCAGAAAPGPMEPSPYEEDDPRARSTDETPAAAPKPAEPVEPTATTAPALPGPIAGEISSVVLHDVLAAGPGRFLAGIEVEPVFRQRRFAGWQIVRFEPADQRIARAPLVAGDIVLAVNARSIAKPQQLQRVWDELRTASELVIAGERSGAAFELRYAIRAAQP